jgi:Type II secretory pathway, component PulF
VPEYRFVAQEASGHRRELTVEAEDLPRAVGVVLRQGLRPVRYRAVSGRERVRLRWGELTGLLHELREGLATGQPAVEVLDAIARESDSPRLRRVALRMVEELNAGRTLSEAMERFADVFPVHWRALIRAGERSGTLTAALESLDRYRGHSMELAERILSAFVYPVIIGFFLASTLSFLVVFLAPRLLQLLEELGADISWTSVRTLRFLAHYYLALVFGAVALAVLAWLGAMWMKRTPAGRQRLDYWRLNAPLVGAMYYNAAISRLADALCLFARHRVDMVTALRLAGEACSNDILGSVMNGAAYRVMEGVPPEQALRRSPGLPRDLVEQFHRGLERHRLPECLEALAATYRRRAGRWAAAAAAVIEPVMAIIFGLVVGTVICAVFAPLVGIISWLSGVG